MVFVYVIESLKDQTWYKGMAEVVEDRVAEHNAGKNRYTNGHRPWKLIHTEQFANWKEARTREKYLKSAAGRRWLKKFLSTGGNTGSLPA